MADALSVLLDPLNALGKRTAHIQLTLPARTGTTAFTNEPIGPVNPNAPTGPKVNGTVIMEESPVPAWAAALSTAGAAIGAYHGYKRNDSIGWAVGWSILGGLAPVIVIPIAFAQGISKRKL